MAISENKYDLELFITTSKTSHVGVRVNAPKFSGVTLDSSFSITAGQVKQLKFSNTLRASGTELSNKGILITATDEVIIYGINKEYYSNDGFLGLPTDVLGKEYYATTYAPVSNYYCQILVIGVYDNTNVEIKFADNEGIYVHYEGRNYFRNSILALKIDRYLTFQAQSKVDLTGTYVRADKPVSFFSGDVETSIGTGRSADHLVEMQFPVESWGKRFALAPIPKRITGDYYRFIASERKTKIEVNGQANGLPFSDSFELSDAGSWVQKLYSSSLYAFVKSDKPILIAQYVLSQIIESADPSMMLIPPIEQYSADYTFSTPKYSKGSYYNYFMFVVKKTEKDGLRVNGEEFPSSTKYHDIAGTDLVAGYIELQDGTHTCKHTSPTSVFGGYLYGRQYHESYAFPVGLRLAPIIMVSNFQHIPFAKCIFLIGV